MGLFDDIISNSVGDIKHTENTFSSFFGVQESSTKEKSTKPKNFDKYKSEIEKTKAYIKSKKEAFYANNNLEER